MSKFSRSGRRRRSRKTSRGGQLQAQERIGEVLELEAEWRKQKRKPVEPGVLEITKLMRDHLAQE